MNNHNEEEKRASEHSKSSEWSYNRGQQNIKKAMYAQKMQHKKHEMDFGPIVERAAEDSVSDDARGAQS